MHYANDVKTLMICRLEVVLIRCRVFYQTYFDLLILDDIGLLLDWIGHTLGKEGLVPRRSENQR